MQLLRDHDILDWPVWASFDAKVEDYRAYVKQRMVDLHASLWRKQLEIPSSRKGPSKHPPYLALESSPGRIRGVLKLLDLHACSEILLRHWCRLRCGLFLLSHLRGKESAAIYQDCIFCGSCTAKPIIHCLSQCRHWDGWRTRFCKSACIVPADSHQLFTLKVMSLDLDRESLVVAIAWASALDSGAHEFWLSQ